MEYEKLRKEYYEKLEDANKVVDDTINYNSGGIKIFDNEDIEKLNKAKNLNDRLLDKLKKGEIEVAIVGMENTGKSSFANSLINLREAFPTDSKRATYTSTELRYGEVDEGVVEFFSKTEFNENFREMLNKVGFDSDIYSFEELNSDTYRNYFEDVLRIESPDIYDKFKNTLNRDIEEILDGKREILRYLDEKTKSFTKDDIANEKLKKFITDKYIARSVKKVNIFLSDLESMREIVIYDVPGFNSTTEKHKEETRKALNRADAIILIKNVIENSQITSEEANILKEADESGIPLSKKLFVFGTKIDRANDKSDLSNIEELNNDLKKNLNVDLNRVFVGSPLAYMQFKGIIEGNNIMTKMEELGLEDKINEVDNIRESIKEFYKNEAFENLRMQINRNIENIKNVLKKVEKENLNDSQELYKLKTIDKKVTTKFHRDFSGKASTILDEFKNETRQDIFDNKYFSNKVSENIDNIVDMVTEEDIQKIHLSVAGISGEFQPSKVNFEKRKELFIKINESFQDLIITIANDKHKEIMDNINKKFLEILEVDETNPYYKEISENISNFISKLVKDVSYHETSFVALIDRFSRDLLELVIHTARGDEGRKNKFEMARNMFLALAFYYDKDIISVDYIHNLEFIKKMFGLIPIKEEYIEKVSISDEFKEFFDKDEVEKVLDFIDNRNLDAKISLKIIKELKENGEEINFDRVLKQRLKMGNNRFSNSSNGIETEFKYEDLFSIEQRSNTKEEVLKELNDDIEIFKDLVKGSVLAAIDLEMAFSVSLIKTIDRIKNNLNNDVTIDLIAENIDKIRYNELSDIENRKIQLENKKRILEDIGKLLTKLNRGVSI